MSDVNYKDFYIKFSSSSNKKTKIDKKEHQNMDVSDNPIKKRKRRSGFFAVVMILVCFSLTFLLAGILSKDGLRSVFSGAENYFAYALVSEVKEGSEKGIMELSKFVRAGGGGGNIIMKDKKYYVVHAAYLNKIDAQKVQARDKSSEIFGLNEKQFVTDYDKLKEYATRYNEEKRKVVLLLYDATVKNAATGDNDSSIKEILKMKEPFLHLKETILSDKNVESNKTLSIIVAIDTIIGKFEGLATASASRISLISDMRYQLFAICSDV